jgi:hypothetical protein
MKSQVIFENIIYQFTKEGNFTIWCAVIILLILRSGKIIPFDLKHDQNAPEGNKLLLPLMAQRHEAAINHYQG